MSIFKKGERVRVRDDAGYVRLAGKGGVIAAVPGDKMAWGIVTSFYEFMPDDESLRDSEADPTWPCVAEELEHIKGE